MRPDYADHKEGVSACEETLKGSTSIKVLDAEEIEGCRLAGKLAREVLDAGIRAVKIGATTDDIDAAVHQASIDRDCYPSPLNYYTFPKSCCTSVNEVICHGIPDTRPLKNGDVVNLDVTVYHKGFHGDLNETVFVGDIDEASKKLVRVTYECIQKGMELIKPGERYREIGNVIQKHAQAHGFSVVRRYCGHGIHRLFHTAPNVPHYAKNKAVGIMKPGHVFTIEPMISEGTWRDVTWPDDWTAATEDGKRSAQFEQTFLVTETGYEILTRRRDNEGRPHFMDQLMKLKA
jgi:methionyl aminopeptidase